MKKLPRVGSFRELVVYQKSMVLASNIFEVSARFPKEETYALTDQIRRSSRSIGAQIAESWGKRRYEKHFISKLTDALSEQFETEHWLLCAKACSYLSESEFNRLMAQSTEVGKMLNSMIKNANRFCNQPNAKLRERSPQYFITT